MTIPNLTKQTLISSLHLMNENIKIEQLKNMYDQQKEMIINYLDKGAEVILFDCLRLKVKKVKARKGRNPKTGAIIDVPARNKVIVKIFDKVNKAIQN